MNQDSRGYHKAFKQNTPLGRWFFFPNLTEVTHMGFLFEAPLYPPINVEIQGSADTTNGIDGVWENGTFSLIHTSDLDGWRKHIMPLSFSKPIKVLRIRFNTVASGFESYLDAMHIYGFKAVNETPDDILFCNTDGEPLLELTDWGDRPEGTTQFKQVKIKNASPNKIANNINLQLNHSDFLMSWNPDGPWTSVLDIQSLGPGALSATIYLKNQLAPPLLILGPKAARIIAGVGSWT